MSTFFLLRQIKLLQEIRFNANVFFCFDQPEI